MGIHIILLSVFGTPVKAMAWCSILGALWALWGAWAAISHLHITIAMTLNGSRFHGPVDVLLWKAFCWQLRQGLYWVEYRVWLWFNSSLFFGA